MVQVFKTYLTDTLNKKRNVPGLESFDDATNDDEPNAKTNLMDLVNNARSPNPETQLNAIQVRSS